MTIVNQFGFSQKSGVLADIVDVNNLTGWAPYANPFTEYSASFVSGGSLNVGNAFPALEFDFGAPTRVGVFTLKTETLYTLGDACVIASDNPASSVNDTAQTGDVILGIYTREEICGGGLLKTAAETSDIRKRYLRILQHSISAVATEGGPGPDGNTIGAFSVLYDAPGSYTFQVPDYSTTFIVEAWGAGASGGRSSEGIDGGDSICGKESLFTITAGGGKKATATNPNDATGAGAGGTPGAIGNVARIAGGAGDPPSPANANIGFSGKGGDAPLGGHGGAAVFNDDARMRFGLSGQTPGGGGSGYNLSASADIGTMLKIPGGGAGAYVKHQVTRGVDGPNPGDFFTVVVGPGGQPLGSANGYGANGRVRISWT